MRAVLISIRPKWVEKIIRGEKTLEVRKTRPKLETPFKCYIYCTNSGVACGMWGKHGKVIGEFVCDRIDRILWNGEYGAGYDCSDDDVAAACLTREELDAYGKHRPLYLWHISGLKLYGEPKELAQFDGLRETRFGFELRQLERPPQSWCYVEG